MTIAIDENLTVKAFHPKTGNPIYVTAKELKESREFILNNLWS